MLSFNLDLIPVVVLNVLFRGKFAYCIQHNTRNIDNNTIVAQYIRTLAHKQKALYFLL